MQLDLKTHKTMLEFCIKGLDEEIKKLKGTNDYSKIIQKELDLSTAHNLFNDITKKLIIEEYAEQNKVSDEEINKLQTDFLNKNKTYSVVRSSYIKSDN